MSGFETLAHAFVVFVGALILAGAVNTAIIGSNGVLNRIAEVSRASTWRRPTRVVASQETEVFTQVVALAEKQGKHVRSHTGSRPYDQRR